MKNISILGTSHAKWIISEFEIIDQNNNYNLIENIKSFKSIINLLKSDSVFFIYSPIGKKQKILLQILLMLKKK